MLVAIVLVVIVLAVALYVYSNISSRAVREELSVRLHRESDRFVSHLKKDIRSSRKLEFTDNGIILKVNAIDENGVPVPKTVLYGREGNRLVRKADGESRSMIDFSSIVSNGFRFEFGFNPVSDSSIKLIIQVTDDKEKTVFERQEQLSPDQVHDEE